MLNTKILEKIFAFLYPQIFFIFKEIAVFLVTLYLL